MAVEHENNKKPMNSCSRFVVVSAVTVAEEPVAEGFGDLFLSAVGADFSADVLAFCTRTPLFPADLAEFCPVDASLLLCLSF